MSLCKGGYARSAKLAEHRLGDRLRYVAEALPGIATQAVQPSEHRSDIESIGTTEAGEFTP